MANCRLAKITSSSWLRPILILLLCIAGASSPAAPGDLDPTFSNGTGPSAQARHIIALPDGKALLAGQFISYNATPRRFLARLQANGALDETFNAGMGPAQGNVQCLAPLPDGKFLAGGIFSTFAAVDQPLLVRLNLDGSVDQTFNAHLQPVLPSDGGLGLVKVQLDGRILIAGVFQFEGETAYRRLARLHSDGSPDRSFEPDFTILWLDDFAILPDGQIIISGGFKSKDGADLKRLLRLRPDGSLDSSFQPSFTASPAYLAVQPDGKILAIGSGEFKRLNPDGSNDESFAPSNAVVAGQPRLLALQPDGRIFVGGMVYDGIHGAPRGVIRLNPGGAIDATFSTGENGIFGVDSLSLDPAGNVFIAGSFSDVNGSSQAYLARLRGGDLTHEGAGTFNVASPSYLVNEVAGSVPIAITRTEGNELPATISYAFTTGTADAADFPVSSGTLSFAAGETTKVISLPLVNDLAVEPDETFNVTLSVPTGGASLGLQATAVITIIDNDKPGQLEWRPVVSNVIEGAGSPAFVVTRNGETTGSITVDYTTVAGTAFAGSDFTAVGGTLTFADGENIKSVVVPIVEDTSKEGIESLSLKLSNPTGGAVLAGGAVGTLNILDNDMPGAIAPGFSAEPVPPPGTQIYRAVVELPDGRILVAGGGQVLRRLQPDGSNDSSFTPQFPEGAFINQIAVQSDGRIILLGGKLRSVAGQHTEIVRLNPDGTEDTTYNLGPQTGFIARMALQPDDCLIVIGNFPSIAGGSRTNMARLTPAGLLDERFTAVNARQDADVILVQPDGKILVVGNFTSFGGTPTAGLIRLHPGGEVDADFVVDPAVLRIGTRPRALAVQPDGKIIAAGRFSFAGGVVRTLIRLLPGGALDPLFDAGTLPEGSTLTATFVLLQPDGKIVADGFPHYTESGSIYSGVDRRYLSGMLDPSFATVGFRTGNVAGLLQSGAFLFSTIEPDGSKRLVKTIGGELDLDLDGEVAFAWPNYEVSETGREAVVYVLRKYGFKGSVSVAYSTSDDTAASGRDYTSQFDVVTFAPGEVAKPIRVPIINTTAIDGTRKFKIGLLRNLFGPELGQPSEVTVAIRDDERAGRLEFEAASYSLREGSSIDVKIKRSLGSDGRVTVNLLGPPGHNATYGSDYLFSTDSITFEPGEPEKTFSIQSPTDGLFEGTETLALQLGVTGGASAGPNDKTIISILDNEDGGSVGSFTLFGASASLRAVAKQPDRKVLLAGTFAAFPDQILIRLNSDGTHDASFNPPSVFGVVTSMAVQVDGKVVLAGEYLYFAGESISAARAVLRLNPDGAPDLSFSMLNATDGAVAAVGLQPDGKIILSGTFTSVNGNARPYIARLLTDGSFDFAFQPAVDHSVSQMAVASDGGVLFVLHPNKIVRLRPDGTVDPAYVAVFSGRVDPLTLSPRRIFLDRHDRLIVGGYFGAVNNQPRTNLVRLLPNGQPDPSFNTGDLFDAAPDVITVQDDGRILLGSYFYSEQGGVVRLYDDGAVDPTFAPQPIASSDWGHLSEMVVLNDAGVLVAGGFKAIDGLPSKNYGLLLLGRLPGAFQFSVGRSTNTTEGVGGLNITVLRVGGSDGRAIVDYEIEAGSALRDSDYVGDGGTLIFENGETSKSFPISIVADSVHENPEQFSVRLADAQTAFLWEVDKSLSIEVTDDDPPLYGTLQFAAASITVNENDGVALLTIERVGGSEQTVSIDFATFPGTAKQGGDFVARSGTVIFADGVPSQTIEIPILGGDIAETDESFSVVLSQPGAGATLGSPSSAVIRITDGDTGTLDDYRGSYAGLLESDDALMDGRIAFTFGARGVVSGVITLGKQRHSFRGQLDNDGMLSLSVPRPGGDPLELTLKLYTIEPDAEQVYGSVSASGVVFEFVADRQTFHASKNPAAAAGRYAVQFDPHSSASLPPGSGYASMTITKSGIVRISGKLSDGAAFTGNGFLSKYNSVQLFVPLYASSGILSGSIRLDEDAQLGFAGMVDWVKPARTRDRYYPNGLAGEMRVYGFAAPPNGFGIPKASLVNASLSGDGLDESELDLLPLERSLPNVYRGAEGLKLKVNPANGLIWGEFKHPLMQRKSTIRGIYLPGQNRGAGFFLGFESTGSFKLSANPPE